MEKSKKTLKKKTSITSPSEKETVKINIQGFLFLLILLIAIVLRLRFITSPIVDFHWQRQIDTAAVARSFYEEEMNIFYPRSIVRGDTPGYVEMEFPIYPFLIAIFYKVFGVHEIIGRIVSTVFAAGTAIYLYLIAKQLIGEKGALFSVALFAFAPLAVYFTRTYQPESMYLFFATTSFYYYNRFLDHGRNKDFVLTTFFLAVAALLKIPIMLVLFFLYLVLGLQKKGFSMFRDLKIWGIAVFSVIPALLWMWHAENLYEMTGLSWSRWLMRKEAFFRLDWFMQPKYWDVVIKQRFYQDLTIIGLLFVIAGLIISMIKRRWLFVFFGNLGFLIYFFLFMRANFAHHYYQLIGILPAALAAGLTGEYLFSKLRLKERSKTLLLLANLVIFLVAGIIDYFYITKNWYVTFDPFIHAGKALASVSKPKDLVVTVNEFGMPEILYFAHRKGWNIGGIPEIEQIEKFSKKGAKYLCVLLVSNDSQTLNSGIQKLSENFNTVYSDIWVFIFDISQPAQK